MYSIEHKELGCEYRRVDDIDDMAVAERVQRVKEYLGCVTDQAFADELGGGVSANRINNVLRGHPLGRELAARLVRRVPGLSVDWLWFGNAAGMPIGLLKALGVTGIAPTPPKPTSGDPRPATGRRKSPRQN